MSGPARRLGAALSAAMLAGAPVLVSPAHALVPPVVDHTALPEPSPPTPPVATSQVAACVVAPRAKPAAAQRSSPIAGYPLADLWKLTRGSGQRVAVIDTGVSRHPRLAALEPAGDYVGYGDGTSDCDAHGTIVAGIIAAAPDPADSTGFSGIAPEVTLLSIRQSSAKFAAADQDSAGGYGDVDTMAAAVRTAADLGATVINVSVVACAGGGIDDAALGAALAYAVDVKDAVVVAAAGNAGGLGHCPRQPDVDDLTWEAARVAVSPAWYDDYVLTVGSVAADGTPSEFSMPGPWVDVAAPGEQVVSLHPSGSGLVDTLPLLDREMPISGTSYAAPVVSGLAALIRARFPELTARQVMTRIKTTVQRTPGGWNPVTGAGIVDPASALSADTIAIAPVTPAARPVGPTAPQHSADPRPARIALAGAAASLLALAAISARRQLHVPGDQRRGAVQGGADR